MKKLILIALILSSMGFVVTFWSRTLAAGLPPAVYLYDFGRLAALSGFLLLFFQYLLSSRVKFIETGIGLDRLLEMHRRVGVLGLVLLLMHPILLTVSERIQGYGTPLSLLKMVGILSLLLLLVAAGSAMLYAKLPWKYESWTKIHKAGYLVFPLGFVHSFFLGSSLRSQPLKVFWLLLGGAFLAIIFRKLWNRIQLRRHPFMVKRVVQESHDTWSLQLEGNLGPYQPGQFMMLQLLRNGSISEPHPFTISSSPTRPGLTITAKAVGDFTSTLPHTAISDIALIDGPFGAFSFLNHDAPKLVFLAGGIGITPFMSMFRYIYDKRLDKAVTLLWGNKTARDILFKEELEKMVSERPSWKVVHVLSRDKEWPGEKGHVDMEKVGRYVTSVHDGEFFLCGPSQMIIDLDHSLRKSGVPRKSIHYERFSLR